MKKIIVVITVLLLMSQIALSQAQKTESTTASAVTSKPFSELGVDDIKPNDKDEIITHPDFLKLKPEVFGTLFKGDAAFLSQYSTKIGEYYNARGYNNLQFRQFTLRVGGITLAPEGNAFSIVNTDGKNILVNLDELREYQEVIVEKDGSLVLNGVPINAKHEDIRVGKTISKTDGSDAIELVSAAKKPITRENGIWSVSPGAIIKVNGKIPSIYSNGQFELYVENVDGLTGGFVIGEKDPGRISMKDGKIVTTGFTNFYDKEGKNTLRSMFTVENVYKPTDFTTTFTIKNNQIASVEASQTKEKSGAVWIMSPSNTFSQVSSQHQRPISLFLNGETPPDIASKDAVSYDPKTNSITAYNRIEVHTPDDKIAFNQMLDGVTTTFSPGNPPSIKTTGTSPEAKDKEMDAVNLYTNEGGQWKPLTTLKQHGNKFRYSNAATPPAGVSFHLAAKASDTVELVSMEIKGTQVEHSKKPQEQGKAAAPQKPAPNSQERMTLKIGKFNTEAEAIKAGKKIAIDGHIFKAVKDPLTNKYTLHFGEYTNWKDSFSVLEAIKAGDSSLDVVVWPVPVDSEERTRGLEPKQDGSAPPQAEQQKKKTVAAKTKPLDVAAKAPKPSKTVNGFSFTYGRSPAGGYEITGNKLISQGTKTLEQMYNQMKINEGDKITFSLNEFAEANAANVVIGEDTIGAGAQIVLPKANAQKAEREDFANLVTRKKEFREEQATLKSWINNKDGKDSQERKNIAKLMLQKADAKKVPKDKIEFIEASAVSPETAKQALLKLEQLPKPDSTTVALAERAKNYIQSVYPQATITQRDREEFKQEERAMETIESGLQAQVPRDAASTRSPSSFSHPDTNNMRQKAQEKISAGSYDEAVDYLGASVKDEASARQALADIEKIYSDHPETKRVADRAMRNIEARYPNTETSPEIGSQPIDQKEQEVLRRIEEPLSQEKGDKVEQLITEAFPNDQRMRKFLEGSYGDPKYERTLRAVLKQRESKYRNDQNKQKEHTAIMDILEELDAQNTPAQELPDERAARVSEAVRRLETQATSKSASSPSSSTTIASTIKKLSPSLAEGKSTTVDGIAYMKSTKRIFYNPDPSKKNTWKLPGSNEIYKLGDNGLIIHVIQQKPTKPEVKAKAPPEKKRTANLQEKEKAEQARQKVTTPSVPPPTRSETITPSESDFQ